MQVHCNNEHTVCLLVEHEKVWVVRVRGHSRSMKTALFNRVHEFLLAFHSTV